MHQIKIKITKEQEGSYFPLKFNVGEKVKKVEIRYQYERHHLQQVELNENIRSSLLQEELILDSQNIIQEEVAIIDFSIKGPQKQFLGSSGSDRNYWFFSANESSKGFARVEKLSGEWEIIVGAYKVPKDGIEVTYSITEIETKRHLIKGDNHLHSQASDGQHSLQTLKQIALDMRLDYLIITDHNNFHPEARELSSEKITIIPGVEWTQYLGHGNMLGVSEAFDDTFVTENEDLVKDRIERIHECGGLFIINHPFCPHVPWLWSLDLEMDALEIINGGTHPSANEKARRWWHQQLCNGLKLSIVGGSDFHRFSLFNSLGVPTTNLYVEDQSESSILNAIKLGHGFVTRTINGPLVDMDVESKYFMGDSAPHNSIVKVTFQNLSKGQIIKLITDEEVQEIKIEHKTVEKNINWQQTSQKFLRVEIWDGKYKDVLVGEEGLLVLISNPIYFH